MSLLTTAARRGYPFGQDCTETIRDVYLTEMLNWRYMIAELCVVLHIQALSASYCVPSTIFEAQRSSHRILHASGSAEVTPQVYLLHTCIWILILHLCWCGRGAWTCRCCVNAIRHLMSKAHRTSMGRSPSDAIKRLCRWIAADEVPQARLRAPTAVEAWPIHWYCASQCTHLLLKRDQINAIHIAIASRHRNTAPKSRDVQGRHLVYRILGPQLSWQV